MSFSINIAFLEKIYMFAHNNPDGSDSCIDESLCWDQSLKIDENI